MDNALIVLGMWLVEPFTIKEDLKSQVELTVDAGQVRQSPHGPVLALRSVAHFDQPENRLETPVVDVALGRQVPPLDGHHHPLQDVGSRRLLDGPRLRAVAGHVRENAGGVVAHLKIGHSSGVRD